MTDTQLIPVQRRQFCARCLMPRCRACGWWLLLWRREQVHLCGECRHALAGGDM